MSRFLQRFEKLKILTQRCFTPEYRKNIVPLLRQPDRYDFSKILKEAELNKFEYTVMEILR